MRTENCSEKCEKKKRVQEGAGGSALDRVCAKLCSIWCGRRVQNLGRNVWRWAVWERFELWWVERARRG